MKKFLIEWTGIWILIIAIGSILALGMSSAMAKEYKCPQGTLSAATNATVISEINHKEAVHMNLAEKLNFLKHYFEVTGTEVVSDRADVYYVSIWDKPGVVYVFIAIDGCTFTGGQLKADDVDKIIHLVPA